MKITDISLTEVSVPVPYEVRYGRVCRKSLGSNIVQVSTDEGLTGIGVVHGPYRTLRSAIEEILLPLLKGQNPMDVERLWEAMYTSSVTNILPRLIGAIDVALWDITGKAIGAPLYRVLGALRDSVPVYIGPSMAQPEVIADQCVTYKEARYPAIKLRVGLGFVGLAEDKTLDKDAQVVERARDVLGPQVDIGVDTDKTYDHLSALRLAPVLEANGVAWFEEPLDGYVERDREQYVDAMVRLQGEVKVPLAAGQGFFTRYQFREMVARHAVDIIQPDVISVGGISELRRVAALAGAWGLKCMPHVNCLAGHDIELVASAHCLASMSNGMYLCYPAHDNPLRTELLVEQPKVVNGWLPLPQKPGLGIEIDPDALAKYTVQH